MQHSLKIQREYDKAELAILENQEKINSVSTEDSTDRSNSTQDLNSIYILPVDFITSNQLTS